MSRIVLVGMSPLPTENARKSYAAGLRTWQFATALVAAGHEVVLVCSRIPDVMPGRHPLLQQIDQELGVERYDIDEIELLTTNWLKELVDRVQPDCLVGAHTFPSSVVADLETDLPIWADLNGHVMAEAQVKAYRYADDRYLEHFWRMEALILDRADALSVVSQPQYFATLGELGLAGRLNQHTVGYPLVYRVPVVCPPMLHAVITPTIRGELVPHDAYVVLWSGGYNTWTDVDTLFAGLDGAMERLPGLYFVSTGGAIEGHDDLTYPRFVQLVERSTHRDRYILRGWLPAEEVPAYYAAADVGLNLDGQNLEAELGTRNRILSWGTAGLAVTTTVVCELSRELAELRLIYPFEVGNAESLAESLVFAHDPIERRQRAGAASEYVRGAYCVDRATAPLVDWCVSPHPAPDRAAYGSQALDGDRMVRLVDHQARTQAEIAAATALREQKLIEGFREAQAQREQQLVAEFKVTEARLEDQIRQLQSTRLGRLGVHYARTRDRLAAALLRR